MTGDDVRLGQQHGANLKDSLGISMSDCVQSVPSQEVLYTLAIYILAKSLHEILGEGSGRRWKSYLVQGV